MLPAPGSSQHEELRDLKQRRKLTSTASRVDRLSGHVWLAVLFVKTKCVSQVLGPDVKAVGCARMASKHDASLLYLFFAIYQPLRARYMTQPRPITVKPLATRDGENFRVKTGQ
jgi:hypothetical protein